MAIAIPSMAAECGHSGMEDSTCLRPIHQASISAPSCPSGQVQTTSPTWNGSSWVGLTCNPPPAPTCGSGQTQVSAPTWNGSSWVGLSCQAVTPPAPVPVLGSVTPNQQIFMFQEVGGDIGAEVVYVMADGSGRNAYLLYGITPITTPQTPPSPSNLTNARTSGLFPLSRPFSTTIAALWGTCQVGVNAPIHCGYYDINCSSSSGNYSCTFSGHPNSWAVYGGGAVPLTPVVTDPYLTWKAWSNYYASFGFAPLPLPGFYTGWSTIMPDSHAFVTETVPLH